MTFYFYIRTFKYKNFLPINILLCSAKFYKIITPLKFLLNSKQLALRNKTPILKVFKDLRDVGHMLFFYVATAYI